MRGWLPNQPAVVRLDKTSYLRGLQCRKLLWTSFHQPETIPAPDPSAQATFEQGKEVGRLAQCLFVGGIDLGPVGDLELAVERTQQALASCRPLFEGTFASGRASARTDILVPVSAERWDLYEVKSSTSSKVVYVDDVAFQVRTLRDAGLHVRRSMLVYINSNYVRHGDLNADTLFIREDVTDQVEELMPSVEDNVSRMQEVIDQNQCPEVVIGPQCDKPYTCPLHDRCWAHLPEHNPTTLVRIGAKAFKLIERGILDIRDIPQDVKLTPRQEIQRQVVISGQPHIDRAAVKAFLARLKYPLYYLDFETIGPAIPVYESTSPFETVPFQFSLHIEQAPGAEPTHHMYLADGTADPRREFMEGLRAVLGDAGSVVVYNAAFEKGVLTRCAEFLPEFRSWVTRVKRRVVDLHLPFKRFDYYDPQQRGSTSIKAVLPAVTGQSYHELEIREGGAASQEYMRITFSDVPDVERQRVRRNLERYCGRDTAGMVWIVETLRLAVRA